MDAIVQLVQRIKRNRKNFKKLHNPKLLPEPLRGRGFLTHPFRSENMLFLILEKSKKDKIEQTGSIDSLLMKFPNLISTTSQDPVAFNLGGTGTYIGNLTVRDSYVFRINNDSTTVVTDLYVFGKKDYVISLAYIIGFGSIIIDKSMSPLLDTLVDRSFSIWSEQPELTYEVEI